MSQELIIREVITNVWTFSLPFLLMGWLPVGGRSTAVKLSTGDVWMSVSSPLTEETKDTLSKLGPVRYLVAPNVHHYFYLSNYTTAYPEAKVIGSQGLADKFKKQGIDIPFTGVYGSSTPPPKFGFENEIDVQCFTGHHNQELAFLHKPSGTLIQADLMFNLPANEQYSSSKLSKRIPILGGIGPMDRIHRLFTWLATTDKKKMAVDVKAVASWEFDRIIPCHGDVIESGGKAAWATAFSSYL